MDIISKDEAKKRGLAQFYTGKLCKHGHDSVRWVVCGRCIECKRLRHSSIEWKISRTVRTKDFRDTEKGKAYLSAYRKSEAGRASNKASRLIKQYGISISKYNQMLVDQNNKCAICEQEFVETTRSGSSPSVDHNHITLEVRSILCGNCNRGIGLLQENITILNNAINYLNKFNREYIQ